MDKTYIIKCDNCDNSKKNHQNMDYILDDAAWNSEKLVVTVIFFSAEHNKRGRTTDLKFFPTII